MSKFNDFGLSSSMGPQLRAFVEGQLTDDLFHYGVLSPNLRFDWSDSCIEGHDAIYLDGTLENFSGIAVFNDSNELVAKGWMDFVEIGAEPRFIVYWDFVDAFDGGRHIARKAAPGIPDHVWSHLPASLKESIAGQRVPTRQNLS